MGGSILIFGAGQDGCGDDAAGLIAAHALERRLADLPNVIITTGDPWMLFNTEPADDLILIDAALADEHFQPGAWRPIDYRSSPDVLAGTALRSIHAPGMASVLKLADTLGQLPRGIRVYAIAADAFTPETSVSDAVRRAVDEVVEAITCKVRRLASSPQDGVPGLAGSR